MLGQQGERWAHIPRAPKQSRGCWVESVAYLQGKLMKGDSSWDRELPALGFSLFPDIPIWQMR